MDEEVSDFAGINREKPMKSHRVRNSKGNSAIFSFVWCFLKYYRVRVISPRKLLTINSNAVTDNKKLFCHTKVFQPNLYISVK